MTHFFLLNKHSIIFFFIFTSWNLIKRSVNYQKVVARPVVLLASVVLNTLKLYLFSVWRNLSNCEQTTLWPHRLHSGTMLSDEGILLIYVYILCKQETNLKIFSHASKIYPRHTKNKCCFNIILILILL